MDTVKVDEGLRDERRNAQAQVSRITASSSGGSDNQVVKQELMRLVDIIEEGYDEDLRNHGKAHASREGNQKHVHVVIQETKNEIKDLTTENKVLQRRLLALQKRRSTIGTKLFLEGAETQYQIVKFLSVKNSHS
ncbi:hypothetical protein KP509_1Z097900 [Ceratopteris richardii]|nr:hypothetical protein KP509_1Z097900 [Ceratopteris richardii]